MSKRDSLKNIKGYIVDMIDTIKAGEEMDGYSAIIKYKDGKIKYISENYDIDASLNLSKIAYMVYENPDDSIDSEGKSIADFGVPGSYNQTAIDLWNCYVNSMLSK